MGKSNRYGSGVLEKATLKSYSNQICQQKYGFHIESYELCAKGVTQESPCSGDSGGPLIYKVKNIL